MSVITLSLNFLNTRKWKQKQVVMLKGLNSRQESWEKHMSWNSTNYAKMNAVLQLSLEFFVKFNQCMRTDFCNLLNLFSFFFSVSEKAFHYEKYKNLLKYKICTLNFLNFSMDYLIKNFYFIYFTPLSY